MKDKPIRFARGTPKDLEAASHFYNQFSIRNHAEARDRHTADQCVSIMFSFGCVCGLNVHRYHKVFSVL